MDPSLLIPTPDSIPVHWGWLHFFFILTFGLHLLFMNAMLGTGIVALVTSLKGNRQDLFIAKEISLKLPYTIAFAINMGVAPLLFIQVLYGNFIYTSSVLMGWYWLLIIGILIIAYYSAYLFDFKFDTLGSARSIFIAVCVILMLLIAFLFTSNITLMLTPEKWVWYFSNAGGTILDLSEPTLIPRYLHFICASMAIGGLFLAIVGKIKAKKIKIGKGNDNFEEMVSSGMKWFSYATLVQVIIGFWFAFSLPKDIILLFLGGSSFATLLFFSGLTGVGAALFFGFNKRVWPSAGAVVFTIVVMVLMRDMIRAAYLKPYFALSELKVEPQYSSMIFFMVTLIAGIGLIGYMLKLATKQRKEA